MALRGMAVAVGGAAAVAAVAMVGLVLLVSPGAPTALITNTGDAPVYYYLPGKQAQQLSTANKQQQMQYFYLPKSVLPQVGAHTGAPSVKALTPVAHPLLAEPVATEAVEPPQLEVPHFSYFEGSMLNGTNVSADGGIPPGHVRSCAITSLRIQAHGVFGQWDRCGYLFAGDPDKKIYRGAGGYISAPANDEDCTPDKMMTAKCSREWTRTVARNNHESLLGCLQKVRGLSQTCDTYSKCGPSAGLNLALGRQSVCEATDGGYYKEPSVERMCGICGMFHAMAGFAHTRDFDDDDDDEDEGGCFAVESVVQTEGRGEISLKDVKVGDKVKVNGDEFKRVYFIHEHPDKLQTLRLKYQGGELELTSSHYLPVQSEACGATFCREAKQVPAGKVRVGDLIYTKEGVHGVQHIEKSSSVVRYVLVEGDLLSVNGVIASVHTSALGWMESLPFKFLDKAFPGLLQWSGVASAIQQVLNSPVRKMAARLNSVFAGKVPSTTTKEFALSLDPRSI